MGTAAVDVFLETHDIQGLVLRGYGSLHAARFLLLEVENAAKARAYLRQLEVDHFGHPTGGCARLVAFTAPGLAALGLPDEILKTFSREFLEGMHDEVRAISLGDDPTQWKWGTHGNIHALVMVYAHTDTLEGHLEAERKAFAGGFRVVREQCTTKLDDHKEHFGWRDGLSMPNIDGVPKFRPRGKQQESWTDPIKPGEFVLGYPNEYGCLSESPTIGRNGTYLVYREIEQHVFTFWDYLAKNAPDDPIALGAKMVGRWPNGAPLVVDPERDNREHATENTFMYSGDRAGLRCPIGAHIRRANPRDVLGSDRPPDDSEIMVRKHQMIRRGRPFGPAISPTMDPREIMAAPRDSVPRGLHFICLVGAISRQFEFVQRAWIHSANFGGLFKDGDPISAARRPAGDPNPNNEFTCPAVPVRRKYKAMPPFTTVVGGAYFFLPGLSALRTIAEDR